MQPNPDFVARVIAQRRAQGLTVETTIGGHTAQQHFATVAARDEYITRAKRCGATVRVITD